MRKGLAALLLTIIGGWLVLGLGTPAVAAGTADANGDVVDRLKIDYTVTADGVLEVREEIVYRFGLSSGRHGIFRDLVIREPWVDDESKDQRYDVSDVRVSSPSGASAEFTEETQRRENARHQILRLKIGSADETIDADTATYVISYKVRGALRHFDDHSELYWDATGTEWSATLTNVVVAVKVPDGVQRAACFAGPNGSTIPCAAASATGGTGLFTHPSLDSGSGLTVVAGIKAGAVSNDTPILDDPPGLLERNDVGVPLLATSGLLAAGVPAAGFLIGRRTGRDERFAGMPPGTLPVAGSSVGVTKNTLTDDQVPVAFSPPRLPVAEAGLMVDAVANTRETAATLIDLAVRGGIRIDNTGNEQRAVLVDPAVATVPHEQVLMTHLFPGLQPGQSITLERRKTGDTSMRTAHDQMIASVRQQVTAQGFYSRMPSRLRGTGLPGRGGASVACFGMVAIWMFGGVLMSIIGSVASSSGFKGALVILPIAAVVLTLGYLLYRRSAGRRTALGRALTDQTLGFRTYLATAEARQLRFEEGEDIFSRYLPWAIVFDLADRWQQVCAELVAAGRIPSEPRWYSGPAYYTSGFAAGSISNTVANTFDPPPAPAGSGGGGGSSSGFSGGSSGGGGGGGGGGSW